MKDMKKGNKTIVAILSVICVSIIVGVLIAYTPITNALGRNDDDLSVNIAAQTIVEKFDADVMCYGKDIEFSYSIGVRYIDNISDECIDEEKTEYKVLIINDLDGLIELSDTEINFIKEKISENKFALVYLGENYSSVWRSNKESQVDVKDNLAYMYYSVNGEEYGNVGAWNKKDDKYLEENSYLLGDTVTYMIEDFLCEN